MKRLLIYTHDLSCHGANKHLCRILPFLNRAFNVTLVVNVSKNSEFIFSLLPNKQKRFLPSKHLSLLPSHIGHMFIETPNLLRASTKLASIVRQCRPDIVMSVGYKSNITALLAKKLSPTTQKSTGRHAPQYACLAQQHLSKQSRASQSIKERYLLKALLKLYKSADLIVTASEGLAIDLAKASPELIVKIKTVHNAGFDPDCTRLAVKAVGEKLFDKREATKKRINKRDKTDIKPATSRQLDFGIEFPETPIITACCNFSPRKNLSLLIKAFAKVHEKNKYARLVILGAPKGNASKNTVATKELTSLTRLVSQLKLDSFIDILPFHKNPYKYLAKSDICVLPSLYEGFGTILTEAMAVGCPVIACNCPAGPNEIIGDNKSGFLVPVDDASVLAQNILLLLSRGSLREKFRTAGLERAKMFSPQKSAEKLIKVLEDIACDKA